jgi:predicted anti-sigma-YlaC factor YlaD
MEENRLYENPEEGFSLCTRVRERLPDLLEGYLDAMTAEAIRAHLSVCYMCARLFGEMEQTIKLVETLPFVDPAKDYAPSIMAAIQQQTGGRGAGGLGRPWWKWRPPPRHE